MSRTSGQIDSIGAAWWVRSRWARTSSTTFSGVRSTHGPTSRSVSGSLDASISMTRECCARSTTSPGATTVPIWMRGFTLAREPPPDRGAPLPAHRHRGRRCCGRRRPRRSHRCSRHHHHRRRGGGDPDRVGPTARGTVRRAHGRQANGCRSISPRSFRSTGGGSHGTARRRGRARPHRHRVAAARAAAAARRSLLPHGRDVRSARRHPGVARRGQRHVTRLGRVPGRLRRHRRLAGVRVLARAGRRQPRRGRAPVDPVERRRLVEERQRHDLPRSRRETSRPTHHRCSVHRSRW